MSQFPPGSACPCCASPFERVTDAAKQIDWAAGDIVVCGRCAGVAMFTPHLALRQATKYEMRQMRTAEPATFADIDRRRIKIREINANERRQASRAKARETAPA